MTSLTIVIPTFKERDNVGPLVGRCVAVFRAAQLDGRLLFVDDNSPDGTADEVRKLAANGAPVDVVVRTAERGLATAVIAGLRAATTDFVAVMDADLSHPPESIPDLIRPLLADDRVQMTIGSRFVPGGKVDLHWPLHRRIVSWLGRMLAAPLTPPGLRDIASGFFAVRRADLRLDGLNPIGYKIALELIVRNRWTNIVEVPITFQDRQAGKTKLNSAEHMRYLRHLARLYGHSWFGRRSGADRSR